MDWEIKRQQGREAKQQLFRKREQEKREQSRSRDSPDGVVPPGDANQKEPKATTATGAAQPAASDGQSTAARKHKLQIIQSLRQESSTESDTQSYAEYRG